MIRRFLRLPAPERRALAWAVPLLAGLRVALAVLPFRRVLGLARKAGGLRPRELEAEVLRRRVWAIGVAGRRIVPERPCLPQALLALVVLRRAGRPADLRIGVLPGERGPGEGRVVAHAWVESEGRVVIGGEDAPERYVALPPIEPDGPRESEGPRRDGRTRR